MASLVDPRGPHAAQLSDDDMKAELEHLRSENAALKRGTSDGARMKVSEEGARLSLWNGALSCDLV